MLQSLEILNGEMTPKFDKYNNIYSVKVNVDVNKLELSYIVDDDYEVTIRGNSNLQEGENTVFVEVKSGNEINIYNLLVTKESTKVFEAIDVDLKPVEIEKELPNYVASLIAVVCFILIIFSYLIIFRNKKHKYKSL